MGVQEQRQSEARQGLACGPSALGSVSSPCTLLSSEYRWDPGRYVISWAVGTLGRRKGAIVEAEFSPSALSPSFFYSEHVLLF